MSKDKRNIDHSNGLPGGSEKIFGKARIPYERSKEEAWANISSRMGKEDTPVIRRSGETRIIASIAATVIILLTAATFLRYHSKTIHVPNGQRQEVTLPDGSTVYLNAQSTLTYFPFWWKISRDVSFMGEGLFEVQKGSTFRVRSLNGTTEVLGTRFNIYSRNEDYRVFCLTGKVKVTSSETRQEAILGPGYEAIVEDGSVKVAKSPNPDQHVIWIRDMFNYTAAPLMDVIEEIERQYNVEILLDFDPGSSYTGSFSANMPAEDVLTLVCKPFGLTFVKRSEGVYQIIQ